MSMNLLMKKLGVVSEKMQNDPLTAITATANTVETNTFDVPCNTLLYGIDLVVTRSDTGALTDSVTQIQLVLDGNKVIKDYLGVQCKAISFVEQIAVGTGFYKIIIADPDLKTDPINLENFTTCELRVTTAALGAGISVIVTPTIMGGKRASYPSVSDLGMGRVLVEKNLPQRQYGAALGTLEYANERVNKVFGYVLATGDNGTLADATFDSVTTEFRNASETITPYNNNTLQLIKQQNAQDNNGNAMPTGIFYLAFPDGISTGKFSQARTLLVASVAGVQKQAQMCERYILGGT